MEAPAALPARAAAAAEKAEPPDTRVRPQIKVAKLAPAAQAARAQTIKAVRPACKRLRVRAARVITRVRPVRAVCVSQADNAWIVCPRMTFAPRVLIAPLTTSVFPAARTATVAPVVFARPLTIVRTALPIPNVLAASYAELVNARRLARTMALRAPAARPLRHAPELSIAAHDIAWIRRATAPIVAFAALRVTRVASAAVAPVTSRSSPTLARLGRSLSCSTGRRRTKTPAEPSPPR